MRAGFKRISIVLLILFTALFAASAESGYSAAYDVAVGWGFSDDSNAKAMGVTLDLDSRYGFDVNRNMNVFVEGDLFFTAPYVQKSNFINVRHKIGFSLGLGGTYTFNGGFNIALSGGVYENFINSDETFCESGIYVTFRPRFLMFGILSWGDYYNASISFPATLCLSGNGYLLKAGIAVGVDCSRFGRRK